jgi:hypothetical protein
MDYLDPNGYVVIAGVVSREETDHAIDLFWEYVASAGMDAKRDRVDTWTSENFSSNPG